uniref:Uncharacterized protein n=1 Tax=Spongospora subterranea TaxID=70186 RepID=A0A0H5R1X6_9EUKA|eukprot:CRZ08215.1 hypothetical protein [Spongospora subterranea]
MNHKIRPRVKSAPVTIFTGIAPSQLLSVIFLGRLDKVVDIPLSADSIFKLTSNLLESLDNIHQSVQKTVSSHRANVRSRRCKQNSVEQANFRESDYCLIATNIRRTPSKTECN